MAPSSYNDSRKLTTIHKNTAKNSAPDQTASNSSPVLAQCLGKSQIFTAFQKVKMVGALKNSDGRLLQKTTVAMEKMCLQAFG